MKLGALARVVAVLGLAVGLAPNAARAATVDLEYDLTLNAMGSGATCPGGDCGTITVTSDTTSTLTYTISLAQGVSFHGSPSTLADVFYFDVSGGANVKITMDSLTGGAGYTYNGITHLSLVPNSGNFPGPYNYEATCTAGKGNVDAGSLCGDMLKFTVTGGSVANPLVIGAPAGHGISVGDMVAFVADLSVSGSCGTQTCNAGTGLVGSGAPHRRRRQFPSPRPGR